MLNDRQLIVSRDDHGAGGVKSLGADEVLTDPGQPIMAQGRHILPDHGFEPDIAGLAGQSRTQADVEILDRGLSFAQVREGAREAGSRHDFQQYVWNASLGHARLDGRPQQAQAAGFWNLVERRDDDDGFAILDFDAQIGIIGHAGGDLVEGGVEQAREVAEFGVGVERPVERATNHQLRFLPRSAFQQAASDVAVTNARRGEDVAPLERRAPGVDNGEDISFGVSGAASFVQRIRAPGIWNRRSRRVTHRRMRPADDTFEILKSFTQRDATWRGADFEPRRNVEEQPARSAPMAQQLPIRLGVVRPSEGGDFRHGGFDAGVRQSLEQGITPTIQRQIVITHDYETHVAQQKGGLVEVAPSSA